MYILHVSLKMIFLNPRWRTAAILKNVKCDMSAAVRPILMKFGMLMDGSHLENRKITISRKQFGRFWRNFAWWHILVFQSLSAVQKIKLLKIQDGGRLPFWKFYMRYLSNAWLILVKFNTAMHIRPPKLTVNQKFCVLH